MFSLQKSFRSTKCKIFQNFKFLNFLKILPRLSTDTLWTVRKVCVEILPQMMIYNKEKSNYNHSNEDFLIIFRSFILDPQKYVRSQVIEIFGQFIYQLEKNELDEQFFNFYKNSLEEYFFNVKEFGIETEVNFYNGIIFNCAYNFPSVLYCFGEEYWHKLKEVYSNLANDKNEKVIMTIISSFHEIAKIVGPNLIESDLLPIYDSFLSHRSENVRNFSFKNLPKLIALMNSTTRTQYLKYLPIFDIDSLNKSRNKYNWRKKIEVLENYSLYFHLFEDDFIWSNIISLCINLTLDNVNKVRKKSSKVLSLIFKYFFDLSESEKNHEINKKIYRVLETYANSKYFTMRIK